MEKIKSALDRNLASNYDSLIEFFGLRTQRKEKPAINWSEPNEIMGLGYAWFPVAFVALCIWWHVWFGFDFKERPA